VGGIEVRVDRLVVVVALGARRVHPAILPD
jgi:hypothetical protein